MLPIDFGNLGEKYPQFAPVYRAINTWIDKHPNVRVLDPMRLRSEMRLGGADVAGAFATLAASGKIEARFGVIAPTTKVLARNYYREIEDIPEVMRDTAEGCFSTADARIVRIYLGKNAQ